MKLAAGVDLIRVKDKEYPASLKEIYDPPAQLYVKGSLPDDSVPKVAVVGSRITSHYGLRTAKAIAADLATAGVVVVSGMALGIDTAAHEGALSVGGKTIAVLGSGFSNLYPRENKKLAEQIIKNGALITEYPAEMEPKALNFPRRNRIISGISCAVLVVEARKKSGALITADFALEQGRDVFAVPGNVDSPKSGGTNWLLKEGAKVAMCAEDILQEMNIQAAPQKTILKQGNENNNRDLSAEEKKLLALFDSEPLHVDVLLESSRMPLSKAISVLSLLEIKGRLKQLPGKNFVRMQ